MTLDLSRPTDREKLEQLISDDLNSYCLEKFPNEFRDHLGASLMGKQCFRELYYSFHWMKKKETDGRIRRLFDVGHRAEPRFIEYLRGVGFEVKEFADDGKQFRISGCNGHYGGSLDGMCKAPARYEIEGDLVLLNEFKTNGTGAGFDKVSKEHLSKAKPEHWAQMCQYGWHYKLKYGLYMIENKNDSSITPKIVELDWNYGAQLELKAQEIISAKEPPAKISENPSFFNCKYCEFLEICHQGAMPEKNCRSCRESTAVENGEWFCNRHQGNIPKEFIKTGCNDWNAI